MDTPPGAEPDDIADIYPTSYYNPRYIWPGLKAHWRTGHETPFPQARVMGGGGSVMGMVALRDVVADPARLKAHLLDNVAGLFHPAGKCRMDATNDPAAAVDPQGRVYGVSGLRVADAAVMPTLIAGNTKYPDPDDCGENGRKHFDLVHLVIPVRGVFGYPFRQCSAQAWHVER